MQIKYRRVCVCVRALAFKISLLRSKVYAYGLLMHARTDFRIHFQTLTDRHIAQTTAAPAEKKQKMLTTTERVAEKERDTQHSLHIAEFTIPCGFHLLFCSQQ